MEANVKRVLARFFALEAPKEKDLWEKASQMVDRQDPFTYNQAMMDIGAMVCTPKAPKCDQCPLSLLCQGQDDPSRYPQPKQRKKVPVRHKHILIFEDGRGKIFTIARSDNFLSGLYGFVEYPKESSPMVAEKPLGDIRQQYSHFTLEAEVFHLPAERYGSLWEPLHNQGLWVDKGAWPSLPHSKADEKSFTLLRATRVADKA